MAPPGARPLPRNAPGPTLFPAVFLRKGAWVFPVGGDLDRTEPFLDALGKPVDVFDATDFLLARYQRVYVVDIEGVRMRRPQFEFLQELAQGKEMWVDAGARNVDEVMDVIVAGASRAVMSTRTLQEAREISRALKLTTQVAFEVVVENGLTVAADRNLEGASAGDVADQARERGVIDIILSSQTPGLPLELAQELARHGPTYVGAPFREADAGSLQALGITGGVFSAEEVLKAWTTSGS